MTGLCFLHIKSNLLKDSGVYSYYGCTITSRFLSQSSQYLSYQTAEESVSNRDIACFKRNANVCYDFSPIVPLSDPTVCFTSTRLYAMITRYSFINVRYQVVFLDIADLSGVFLTCRLEDKSKSDKTLYICFYSPVPITSEAHLPTQLCFVCVTNNEPQLSGPNHIYIVVLPTNHDLVLGSGLLIYLESG